MAVLWLIQEWLNRLLRIRTQLEADAANGEEWLLRIRARILGFLIARYGEQGRGSVGDRPAEPPRERQLMLFDDAFSAGEPEKWVGGAAAAPRKSKELRTGLSDIRRINASKRDRWRWWP